MMYTARLGRKFFQILLQLSNNIIPPDGSSVLILLPVCSFSAEIKSAKAAAVIALLHGEETAHRIKLFL